MAAPPVGAAIVVGVTVFFLVIVASVEQLSAVPANVYGYAALVGYSLHHNPAAPATGPLQNLGSANFANPLSLLILSIATGTIFLHLSAPALHGEGCGAAERAESAVAAGARPPPPQPDIKRHHGALRETDERQVLLLEATRRERVVDEGIEHRRRRAHPREDAFRAAILQ